MSWSLFLLRRLAALVPTLAALSVLVFGATELLPGDAVGAVAGPDATEAERAAVRERLGLDDDPVTRYLRWAGGAVRGDLGTAYTGGRAVHELIASRLPHSLLLAGLALAVTVPLSIALGLWAGSRAGRRADRAVSTGVLLVAGLPEFVTATALWWLLAGELGLLPRVSLVPLGGSPLDTPEILVLPALTLAATGVAVGTRLVRSASAEAVASPWIEAARLRGVGGARLAVRHVLPGALAPATQAFGLITGALVGGAIVVETVYGYPGIGLELQQAVAHRDIPLVQGIALVLCAATLATVLLADLAARALDPRRGSLR
ncbi:peptide/nickel transport system permease protein [Streptomyces zhaozhouensis]|uniref:Peptide/nickel transport system permease protein n=1 Tax=Streptomyces zhaozhouensis TaxID=1300267 RepID=A0A286DVH2_9ACTN|nr:ABC transporter permease [Streptomyces zhaozhouensis]SOD62671.1 peptide/nickel transport system permease protein [Streptomyces zhaozhouensis]